MVNKYIRFNVRDMEEYYEVHMQVTDAGPAYWSALTDDGSTTFDDYATARNAMRTARETYPESKLRIVSYDPIIEHELCPNTQLPGG